MANSEVLYLRPTKITRELHTIGQREIADPFIDIAQDLPWRKRQQEITDSFFDARSKTVTHFAEQLAPAFSQGEWRQIKATPTYDMRLAKDSTQNLLTLQYKNRGDDAWQMLANPNTSPSDQTHSIREFFTSPGDLIAYTVSLSGDAKKKAESPYQIRVKSKTDPDADYDSINLPSRPETKVAWLDNNRFLYTRSFEVVTTDPTSQEETKEVERRVFLHTIQASKNPSQSDIEIPIPKNADPGSWLDLYISPDRSKIGLTAAPGGDQEGYQVFVGDSPTTDNPTISWQAVVPTADMYAEPYFNSHNELVLAINKTIDTRQPTKGSIVHADIATGKLTELVPANAEGKVLDLDNVKVWADGLLLPYRVHAHTELAFLAPGSAELTSISNLPPLSTVKSISVIDNDHILVHIDSFTNPGELYEVKRAKDGSFTATLREKLADVNLQVDVIAAETTTEEQTVRGHDVSPNPVTLYVLKPSDTSIPIKGLLMRGYNATGAGGNPNKYLVDQMPLAALAEQGWIIGLPIVRGSDVEGIEAHTEGTGDNYLNSVADLVAGYKYIMQNTSGLGIPKIDPENTVYYGGSAGTGLGADASLLGSEFLKKDPDLLAGDHLFGKLILAAPYLDFMTEETEYPHYWRDLFGNPNENPDKVASYSPYRLLLERAAAGAQMPAMYLLFSDPDIVNPLHALKFAATGQQASLTTNFPDAEKPPILVDEAEERMHGTTSTKQKLKNASRILTFINS